MVVKGLVKEISEWSLLEAGARVPPVGSQVLVQGRRGKVLARPAAVSGPAAGPAGFHHHTVSDRTHLRVQWHEDECEEDVLLADVKTVRMRATLPRPPRPPPAASHGATAGSLRRSAAVLRWHARDRDRDTESIAFCNR